MPESQGLAPSASLVIGGVVLTNAIIGYITESQSEKIIHSLTSDSKLQALIIRDGNQKEIDATQIVPGDILLFKSGNYVGADARLFKSENLQIDESALTGESVPVVKKTHILQREDIPLGERENMAYKGTFVTGGKGYGVVVATGKYTEMGQIQEMVSQAEASATPLQQQLDQVGSQLVMLGGGICGLVFGLGLLRGYGFLQMLKTSISLAVASVPEGLPTVATTTLALGIQDMRKHHILVRGLNAIEALGSVQAICLDKTGTITQNKMIVEEIRIRSAIINQAEGQFLTQDKETIDPKQLEEFYKLIQVSGLCSDSEVQKQDDGKYEVKGSATENALIYMGIDAGIDLISLTENYPRIAEYPRTDEKNIMTTVHQSDNQHKFVAVKGSPEEVLAICTSQMKNGEVVPLTEEDRQELILDNEKMAGKALRVLGVAYAERENLEENPEQDLIWLGLTGMADPIRKGVPKLMEGFHQAGIDTVMITGDQSATAYAIAKHLNLSRDRRLEILDSSDITHVPPEKLQALCKQVDVFARISPADKLQIVQALQASGKIVGMTGDGINDTPALKAANVGVAMGAEGTEVVNEVADVVIEDNNLQTMINAVSRGRTIYNNIRKSVHFLLATNLSEIIVMTGATAVGIGEPLNAMQLLWLNLVSDIFPGLALALEPPEADILSQPPRNPDEPIIKEEDFERIVFESSVISLSALGIYSYGLLKYGVSRQSSTLIFMGLTISQILHTLSCRSESHSIFEPKAMPPNPYVDGAIIGSLGLQLLPLAVPGLRNLLRLAPLDPFDYLVIGTTALFSLIINEMTKSKKQGDKR